MSKKAVIRDVIIATLIALILFTYNIMSKPKVEVYSTEFTTEQVMPVEDTFRLLSFNIQVFGRSKMNKPEVVDILVNIINQFDMIAIQEVRDASGESVPLLVNMLDNRFNYILGPREGRSSSKEQYLYIYDKNIFTPVETWTFEDPDDIFERNPMAVFFETSRFDFVLINNHISPGSAKIEIAYMPTIMEEVEKIFSDPDVIAVGDFNADGSYFKEVELGNIFPKSKYSQLIPNDVNTTVAVSDNTYDRIIITDNVIEDWTGEYGVYIFEDYYEFINVRPKDISDHYPVYVELYLNKDSN